LKGARIWARACRKASRIAWVRSTAARARVKVDVDGAVTAAADVLADALADVLADVSTDLLGLAHGALRLQPLAKIAIGMTGRVPPSRPEDFAGSLICHRETPDYC